MERTRYSEAGRIWQTNGWLMRIFVSLAVCILIVPAFMLVKYPLTTAEERRANMLYEHFGPSLGGFPSFVLLECGLALLVLYRLREVRINLERYEVFANTACLKWANHVLGIMKKFMLVMAVGHYAAYHYLTSLGVAKQECHFMIIVTCASLVWYVALHVRQQQSI